MATLKNACSLADQISSLEEKIENVPYNMSTIKPKQLAAFQAWLQQGNKLAEQILPREA